MKKKCFLCNTNKARRICQLCNGEMICSPCCGDLRNTDCKDCRYYQEAQNYQKSKTQPVAKKEKHFFAEINEEVEMAVDHALALVEKGNIDGAEGMLDELAKKYPPNYMVKYGQGLVQAFRGKNEEAVKYFSQSTDIFPYFPETHYNKAVAYKNLYDIKNTVASFNEVIKTGDPQDEIVKSAKEFIDNLERSILRTDNIPLAEYFQAQEIFEKAFSHMEKREWSEATKNFKACLMINKNHTQSFGNLGICYAHLGKKEEAVKALDKALELDPDYEPALANKAMIESLADGEKLPNRFASIEYYKDYKLQNKSYLKSILTDDK